MDINIFHTAETLKEKTKEKDTEKWGGAFPVGPAVKNLPSNAGDEGLIPGGGTKIPQATQHGQKTNKTVSLTCSHVIYMLSQNC